MKICGDDPWPEQVGVERDESLKSGKLVTVEVAECALIDDIVVGFL